MFNLSEEETLARVHKYELFRGDGRLRIDIYEVIAGEKEGKFFAHPNILTRMAKEQFVGSGDSEMEALEDCLTRIKGVSGAAIFPAHRSEP